MNDLNKGLRQPNGSVAEDMQLIAIAAHYNIPLEQLMFLRKGYTVNKARFAYDEDLSRIWQIPYNTPEDTVIDTVIAGLLNGSYQLEPADLLISGYHFTHVNDMAKGAWLYSNKDLVWCIEDNCWYRYVPLLDNPIIAKAVSPKNEGTVYSPTNPQGVWEDMGNTGLGASFKGNKGEDGVSVEYIKVESTYNEPTENNVGYTVVTLRTKISNKTDEEVHTFTIKDGAQGKQGNSVEYVKTSTVYDSANNRTEVTIKSKVQNSEEQTISFYVKDGESGKDGSIVDFDPNQFTTKLINNNEVVTIKNDPDSANQLSVIGNGGLFVRPASAQIRKADNSIIVRPLNQDKNGGLNTEIGVQISPEEGNILELKEKGLYVPSATNPYIAITDPSNNAAPAIGDGIGNVVIGSGAGENVIEPTKTAIVVAGALAKALSSRSVTIGYNSGSSESDSVTIGTEAHTNDRYTIAAGSNASATQRFSSAIGSDSVANHSNSVAIGYGTVTYKDNSLSIGTESKLRGITCVDAAVKRTDVPNWGQVQDLTQVTELVSTKENPVNLNNLSGAMTYRIREGDYNAETNPNPYTIINAPNYADRSASIEVYIHTDGILQECKTPDQKYTRLKGTTGRRGVWGIVTNDKTAPSYYFGGVNGNYWEDDTGIFTKNNETVVIGTPDEPVNTMFVPFTNPLASATGNGVLTGISHAYGYNGKVKLFLQRRTGTASTGVPRPDELFNYAMVSDDFKNRSENSMPLLATDSSNTEIIERINQITKLLNTAGIVNI